MPASSIFVLTSPNTGHPEVTLSQPIILQKDKYQYSLALHSASLWYSWANVAAPNNVLTYSPDNGATWKAVTIPAGNYGLDDINNYLHSVMKINNDFTVVSSVDTFDITIGANYNTLRTKVTVSNNYRLDMTNGIRLLFGFESQIITATKESENLADISGGIDSLLIQCDIIQGSYLNNRSGQSLAAFLPSTPPGGSISVQPRSLIFCDVYVDIIRSIRITVTDQTGRLIDFRGEGSTYLLELKVEKL